MANRKKCLTEFKARLCSVMASSLAEIADLVHRRKDLEKFVQDGCKAVARVEHLGLDQRKGLVDEVLKDGVARAGHIELDNAALGIVVEPLLRSTGCDSLDFFLRLAVKLLGVFAYRPDA